MHPDSNPQSRPPSRLMSQSAAARALGLSRTAVMARVASGDLTAETVDESLVIVRASVERYLAAY